MMDLADIRKKARAQSAEPPESLPVLDDLLPEVDELRDLPVVSVDDERFWSEIGTEQFASEEEYSRGLTDSEGAEEVEQAQWLGFYLGNEEYALDIEVVSELIKPRVLTELPQVPTYIRGIIALRGEVIPIVDLRIRLGLELDETCDVDLQRIIVCEGKEQRVGLLVDRISQVVRLPVDEIEKPQLVGDNPATAFIQGVGRKQGRMLIQLRPEKAVEIEAGVGS
jgi:purine-binding chemotaxis protein CheW